MDAPKQSAGPKESCERAKLRSAFRLSSDALELACWTNWRTPEHRENGHGSQQEVRISCIMVSMVYMVCVAIIWTSVKGGLHGKSQGGHYFIYKNLDLETGSNRWFGNYIKFGEQESLIIFSGCDSLEDAQASCERHAQNRGEAL